MAGSRRSWAAAIALTIGGAFLLLIVVTDHFDVLVNPRDAPGSGRAPARWPVVPAGQDRRHRPHPRHSRPPSFPPHRHRRRYCLEVLARVRRVPGRRRGVRARDGPRRPAARRRAVQDRREGRRRPAAALAAGGFPDRLPLRHRRAAPDEADRGVPRRAGNPRLGAARLLVSRPARADRCGFAPAPLARVGLAGGTLAFLLFGAGATRWWGRT